MPTVRKAELAGRWYEADPSRLGRELKSWSIDPAPGPPPVLVLVPHAGHMWSGAVAGAGFSQLRDQGLERIVLLAPSHRLPFQGLALPPDDLEALDSPLGTLEVDREFVRDLARTGDPFVELFEALAHEHALEVELPFLAWHVPGVRIVPLVAGHLGRSEMRRAGEALGERLDHATAVVVSSDLTHYGEGFGFEPYGPGSPETMEQVEQLDRQGLDRLLARDPEGWLDHRERTGWTACGTVPAAVALWALPDDCCGEVIRYDTSAALSGDYARSVSYGAAVMRCERPRVPRRAREVLRQVAAAAVREAAGLPADPVDTSAVPAARFGAFVTLKLGGALRGCVGSTIPALDLAAEVDRVARRAALADTRFAPLSAAEVDGLSLSVSVLSPLRRIASIEEARVPCHGLYVRWHDRSGLLLPQVAEEHGLDRDQFLEHTLRKAGIPGELPADAELYVFAATVF